MRRMELADKFTEMKNLFDSTLEKKADLEEVVGEDDDRNITFGILPSVYGQRSIYPKINNKDIFEVGVGFGEVEGDPEDGEGGAR